MMNEGDYRLALALYVLAGLAAVLALTIGRRPPRPRIWPLPLAALLLTPALIEPRATTFAPALIVTAFQVGTGGLEAALHALRPLALSTGLALVLAVAWSLWRRRAP